MASSPAEISSLPADEAIPRLLEEHGGRLYRLALRFCGTPQDAEDLVQETFLLAFRKWDQFRGDSRPTTWLYTIAARSCQRAKRRRSGEPRTLESLSALLPSGEPQVPDVSVFARTPLDESLRHEAEDAVERAIARLPTLFRMPLVLKDLAELSVAEVAQVLGLKEATVKTRVHRARLGLRRDLARVLPSTDAPPPDHARRICLDLLRAKQEGLDRGVPFPVSPEALCSRCRALFATLDLVGDICHAISAGELPDAVKAAILEEVQAESHSGARGVPPA